MVAFWRLIVFFIILLMVFACAPLPVVAPPTHALLPTNQQQEFRTSTPTRYPTQNATPFIITPLVTPSRDNTPQVDILRTRCLDVRPSMPTDLIPEDLLVMNARGNTTIWDLIKHEGRRIQGNVTPTTAAVSPDGNWLAYSSSSYPENIIVSSPDGKKLYRFSWKREWVSSNLYWLGNQYLRFPVFLSRDRVPDVDIVNPFSGDVRTLISKYPNISVYLPGNYGIGGRPPLHFGNTSVLYNPDLDLAVYPETIRDEASYITLWDRNAGKVIARIFDDGRFEESHPQWLPDGNQLVVFGIPDEYRAKNHYQREWLLVNRNGQVKQLTRLSEYYDNYLITGGVSISPDGNYLTFSLEVFNDQGNPVPPGHFIILDLQTREAIDTCLENSELRNIQPSWSFESKYLVTGDQDTENPAILLNVKDWWAAYLAKDQLGGPVGWLRKRP